MLDAANPMPIINNANEARGLVFAFQFDAQGVGMHADFTDAARAATPHGGYWWVHAHLTDTRCRKWLATQDWLTEEAHEILLSQETHDRIEHRLLALDVENRFVLAGHRGFGHILRSR